MHPLGFVKASRARCGLSYQKTLFDGRCYMYAIGTSPYTYLLFLFRMRCFSAIHVIGAFTWNAVTHHFQECQKVRCLHCQAFVSLSAAISKPFLHRWPYGAVSQHTERQRWLIRSTACISNYFSVPREICYLWITVLTLQLGL